MNTKTEEVYITIDSKKYPWDKLVELEVNVFAFLGQVEIFISNFESVDGKEQLVEKKLTITVESGGWPPIYAKMAALQKRTDALILKSVSGEFGKDARENMVNYRLINLFNFLFGKSIRVTMDDLLEINHQIIIEAKTLPRSITIPGNDINFQKFIDFSKYLAMPFERPVEGWKI